MPLPDILMPAALPRWLAAGHEQQQAALYAHPAFTTGHTRTRRVFTAAERVLSARMELTQDQLTVFHAWHEGTLRAGLLRFAAQFANLGPGLVWFDAQLLRYTSRRLPQGGRNVLEVELLLRGDPSPVAPALTSASDETLIALEGSALLLVSTTASDESLIALLGGVGSGTADDLTIVALEGSVVTGLQSGDEALMRVWMGLAFGPASVDQDDGALAAEWMRH